MGKGTIVSHIGLGQYSVTLNKERARITAAISALTARIAEMETRLAGMEEGRSKKLLALQIAALELRKTNLENAPADPTVSAWCADLTEDLTGEVGTIEIPGERGVVQIQPGYDGNAVYSEARDGQLQDVIASTPAGTFYNLAMLPGWQRWEPTFRIGTVSALDTGTDQCTITLDVAVSSAQGLGVNPDNTVLTGVPIEYMECNSIAFEDGDRVVVEFEGQSWASPKVIGFETEPRICATADVYVSVIIYTNQDWDEPMHCWVWNLARNSLAHVTDAAGNEMTQPLTSTAQVNGFMSRQGIAERGMSGAFGRAPVATEIWPWLETSPVTSHLCAMDGSDFLNYSNLPSAYSGMGSNPPFKRNIHNFHTPGYEVAFDAEAEDSCFVLDYTQEEFAPSNIVTDTYTTAEYWALDGVYYCDSPLGVYHPSETLIYTKSYDYVYQNTHEVQTPLGATTIFFTGGKINYASPGLTTGMCGGESPYPCEKIYSTRESVHGVHYYPSLSFCQDAFLTAYITTWYIDENHGPWDGNTQIEADTVSSYQRYWDIAIAAKYLEEMDARTMSKADIVAKGRNTKLEEFVDEKLTAWLAVNDVPLTESGGGGDDYVTGSILDHWAVELKLYGAAAS